jgi:hypothetical protein
VTEDLAKWLLKQIGQDEDEVRGHLGRSVGFRLAECDAKRRIIDLHEEGEENELRHGHWEGHGSNEHWIRDEPNDCPVCDEYEPCLTLRLLALPYADRPGYRAEWKP